jgi:hypothetical protein
MRSSLRNWDSKITFFAFADVITSVCGMLIFITLLLATDLERRAEGSGSDASSRQKQELTEILRQQAEADTRNARLQSLLDSAETAPAPGELKSDISSLRSQLSAAREKEADLAAQLDTRQASLKSQDHILGLDQLNAAIGGVLLDAQAIAGQEARVRRDTAEIDEQEIPRAKALVQKAHERDGQIWLIPGKTDKEAIVVTLGGSGATIERFNHPELRKQIDKNASLDFEGYLAQSHSDKQYFVFYVRPSGIGLFKTLVSMARFRGFDVGSDALEEGRQVHYSTPPPLEVPEVIKPLPPPATGAMPSGPPGTGGAGGGASAAQPNLPPAAANPTPAATNSPSAAAPAPPPAPKPKSWWQRFLEWIGLA